jgi:hypothetical protein
MKSLEWTIGGAFVEYASVRRDLLAPKPAIVTPSSGNEDAAEPRSRMEGSA